MKEELKALGFEISDELAGKIKHLKFETPTPDVGLHGFIRLKGKILPAQIQSVKKNADGDTNIVVVFFDQGVSAQVNFKTVELGLKVNCWWHSLEELRVACSIERERLEARDASNTAESPGGVQESGSSPSRKARRVGQTAV